MINLNDTNGAAKILMDVAIRCMHEFEGALTGAEFGIAYGGGVEAIGKLWKGRGAVYGFDTFEGHPRQVGDLCEFTRVAGGSKHSFAANCMNGWYDKYDPELLTYKYQRYELDRQGLENVHLVQGLVDEKTYIPFPQLHYCLLDLDFPLSIWQAYNLVKEKIVPGGYLCLHDCIPKGHIPGCWEYYQKILDDGLFRLEEEHFWTTHLVTLRKI